jgi:hypothetical protein
MIIWLCDAGMQFGHDAYAWLYLACLQGQTGAWGCRHEGGDTRYIASLVCLYLKGAIAWSFLVARRPRYTRLDASGNALALCRTLTPLVLY